MGSDLTATGGTGPVKVRADEPEPASVDPKLVNDLRHSLKTFSIYGAVWAKAKPAGLGTAQRIGCTKRPAPAASRSRRTSSTTERSCSSAKSALKAPMASTTARRTG